MPLDTPGGSRLRLAELVATLSLATDLARGRPLEQGLGTCLLAVGLGEEAGLAEDELARVWYGALLRHVGCTADNHLLAAVVGDEIAFSAGLAVTDTTSPEAFAAHLAGFLRRTGGPEAAARLPALAAGMGELAVAVCEVAELLADRLGLGPEVRRDLTLGAERFDGRGFRGLAGGEQVPVAVRVVQVAETARLAAQLARPAGPEVADAVAAAEAATVVLGERAGHALDPGLVECFRAARGRLLGRLVAGPLWDQVLASEPGPRPELTGDALASGLAAMAEFVDLKSPSMVGHSSGVARLAGAAAARAGLPPADQAAAARAGLVHDLGRVAISSAVWERPGPLTLDQRERVRLHAYYTERVLAASPGLAGLGALASLHHERLDGSGYHRGAASAALPPVARVLAAADAYQAMTEPRPHRPPLDPDVAAAELRAEVRAGRLDADAAAAVLEAAGRSAGRRRPRVAGLTAREVEVLGLLARGRSNRQIAAALTISPKTADAHVQHIYAKIGVTTRAAAAVFAMRHDLVGPAGR
jgi:response regulator RpfG family c-di-GMP phosphodiesterase/DNA-binding CsgD family transcriptional regulator